MSEVEKQTEQAAQEQNVELTLQDLAALKSVVDVASSRGAFKPNEMVAVGTVYNKLTGFLEAIAKQQEEAKQAEAPAEGA